MKPILAFAAVLLTAQAAQAQGQPAAPSTPRILGVDGMIAIPTGDYADAADMGIGALGRVEVPMGLLTITGRAGVVVHLMDQSDASLTFIPIYGGVRYPIADSGLYLAGELGITLGYVTIDTPFGSGSDSDTEVGGSFSVGMRRGGLTVQGGLFIPDLGDDVAIGGSVGLDLVSF